MLISIPFPFALLLEPLREKSTFPVDGVDGPSVVSGSFDDGDGISAGAGIIFKGALASYITPVVCDRGFVEGNVLSAVMRFVTSGLCSATPINSSRLPDVGVSNESTPNTAFTVYEIVVGVADVPVAIHVTSSKVMNGVRSNVSIMYCSKWAHVT